MEPEHEYDWCNDSTLWKTGDNWKIENTVAVYRNLRKQAVNKRPIIATEKDVGTDILQRLEDL